jgi:alpha-D-ribose 1-methylphosphonate 5-triphosphate diphosphatase PhnM
MASTGLSETEALDLRERRLAAQATHMAANRAHGAIVPAVRAVVFASHADGTIAHIAEAPRPVIRRVCRGGKSVH